MIKNLLKNYKLYIVVICLLLFSYFFYNVLFSEIQLADKIGYNFIYNNLRNDYLTMFAVIISSFVSPICIGGFIILSFIVIKNKRLPFFLTINTVIVFLFNTVIKNLISRPRPPYGLYKEVGYSFPSAHAMVSLAFYGFVIYLIYCFVKNKKIKWISIVLLTLLIILIGLSRIYLGVHYTSDVLGGFTITLAYLVIYTSIVNKYLVKEK